jgi:hypothetical protein
MASRPVLEKVLGAIMFGVVFLGTLVWGALPFTFGVAVAAVIGSVELFSMFETKGEATPTAAVVGIAASLAYVFLAHYRPIESIGYVTVGLIFLSFIWYMMVLRHVKPTKAVALTIFAPLLAGFCLSYLVMLRDFAGATNPDKNNGWWLVVFMIAVIWIYDVGNRRSAAGIHRPVGHHKGADGAPEVRVVLHMGGPGDRVHSVRIRPAGGSRRIADEEGVCGQRHGKSHPRCRRGNGQV